EERSDHLAAYLRELGAGPESCVALLIDRSIDFVVAALGVLKAGAAYLPLDPSTPPERAAHILKDSGLRILLTSRRVARDARLNCGNWQVVEVDQIDPAILLQQSREEISANLLPDSLAYVIYTSGSTGLPKGVEITHANLCNLIDWHI